MDVKKKNLYANCDMFGATELNYQNFHIKTFIVYEINSAMKIFCAIRRFSGWVEDKGWTDSLSCYKTEGFLSECIAPLSC